MPPTLCELTALVVLRPERMPLNVSDLQGAQNLSLEIEYNGARFIDNIKLQMRKEWYSH